MPRLERCCARWLLGPPRQPWQLSGEQLIRMESPVLDCSARSPHSHLYVAEAQWINAALGEQCDKVRKASCSGISPLQQPLSLSLHVQQIQAAARRSWLSRRHGEAGGVLMVEGLIRCVSAVAGPSAFL